MPRIVIANWAEKTLDVADVSRTLLQHFHEHGLDWMHACGGKGRCTTCKARIISGTEHLPPITVPEQKYRHMGALKSDERLCCQTRISADIVIEVPDEYKLPHIRYESR